MGKRAESGGVYTIRSVISIAFPIGVIPGSTGQAACRALYGVVPLRGGYTLIALGACPLLVMIQAQSVYFDVVGCKHRESTIQVAELDQQR